METSLLNLFSMAIKTAISTSLHLLSIARAKTMPACQNLDWDDSSSDEETIHLKMRMLDISSLL